MFSSSEPFFRAMRDLFDAQTGIYARSVHAVLDAGVSATEMNVDSIRTLLATATVATRQWFSAGGAGNWPTPVPGNALPFVQFAHFAIPVRLPLAAPRAGATPSVTPEPGTATGTWHA